MKGEPYPLVKFEMIFWKQLPVSCQYEIFVRDEEQQQCLALLLARTLRMLMDFKSFTFQWMAALKSQVSTERRKKALANQWNPWEFGFSCPSPPLLEIVELTRSWGNARFCHVSSMAGRGKEDRWCLHPVKPLSKGGPGVQADSGAWVGSMSWKIHTYHCRYSSY